MSNLVLSGEIDLIPIDPEATTTLGAVEWWVQEFRQGWTGLASVNPVAQDTGATLESALGATVANFAPGKPINFGLWARAPSTYHSPSRSDEAQFMRSWPSVVKSVQAPWVVDTGREGQVGSVILFKDPVSFLLDKPIWGCFKDLTVGELVSGGLMLATGVVGVPDMQPVIPDLPPIRLQESTAVSGERIPYAIASGETLGEWLGAIFGRTGFRMEMLGDADGTLHVFILDGMPGDEPVPLQLNSGSLPAVGASAASIRSLGFGPSPADIARGVLVDNPAVGQPQRIGEASTIGRLIAGSETSYDVANKRVQRVVSSSDLLRNVLEISTAQPGLHAGRSVAFDRSVVGADIWQVHSVKHAVVFGGAYSNIAKLFKLGAWAPAPPRDRGAVFVSAVVHAPNLGDGETVESDEMGRIPVRLSISQGSPAAGAGSTGAGDNGAANGAGEFDPFLPTGPELLLPVLAPMSGAAAGFVPGHRQGDICQIAVHQPMLAEVVGFGYSSHRPVPDELLGATMGLVAGSSDEAWSGMIFMPKEEVDAEDEG